MWGQDSDTGPVLWDLSGFGDGRVLHCDSGRRMLIPHWQNNSGDVCIYLCFCLCVFVFRCLKLLVLSQPRCLVCVSGSHVQPVKGSLSDVFGEIKKYVYYHVFKDVYTFVLPL